MKTNTHLQSELRISGATVANWVKTGVIPPYPNGRYFEEEMYFKVLEPIKNDFLKLQKRANRSGNDTNSTTTSTISATNTKEIIENLSKIFEKSSVSLSFFMFSLALNFLKNKGLVIVESQKITSKNKDFTDFFKRMARRKSRF